MIRQPTNSNFFGTSVVISAKTCPNQSDQGWCSTCSRIGMLRASVQSWDPECWRPSPWGLAIYWLPTSEKYPKPSSDSTSPWRIWTPKAWSLTIAAKQSVNEANNFIKGNLLLLQEKKVSFQFPPQKMGFLVISQWYSHQPSSTRHWSTLPNQLSNSSAPSSGGDQRPKTVAMLIWWNGLVTDLVFFWVNGR